MMRVSFAKQFVAAAISLAMMPLPALAQASFLTASGGGYGQSAMTPNDDDSSSILDLPFNINFYGQSYSQFYVNNNGNVTFANPLGDYTPFSFSQLGTAMIAPFWADVDTRNPLSGQVYVGSFAAGQMSITWDRVGYFAEQADKLNSFQLNLYSVGNNGDFDIEFRYGDLNWTTGDASSGINGLGGIPAVAGFTNGGDVSYLQPGSFNSPGALNWMNTSNLAVSEPGRWVYNVRNAAPPPETTPGLDPNDPILPDPGSPDDAYQFTFDVQENTVYFIDPPMATGYDFSVAGGPLFATALFSTPLIDALGDPDSYDLYSFDGANYLGSVTVGQTFNFASPLAGFQVRGIDPANMLSPTDPTVFVTGFSFDGAGTAVITQKPFIENIGTAPVPEPAAWAMMIGGFLLIGTMIRFYRRRIMARYLRDLAAAQG